MPHLTSFTLCISIPIGQIDSRARQEGHRMLLNASKQFSKSFHRWEGQVNLV